MQAKDWQTVWTGLGQVAVVAVLWWAHWRFQWDPLGLLLLIPLSMMLLLVGFTTLQVWLLGLLRARNELQVLRAEQQFETAQRKFEELMGDEFEYITREDDKR